MTRGPGPLWPTLKDRPGFCHLASRAHSEKLGVLDFLARSADLRARGPFDLLYTSHVHVNALASLALRLRIIRAERFVSRESTRIFDRFHGWRSWIYRVAYGFYGRQDLLLFQTQEMRASLEGAVALPAHIPQLVFPNPVNLANVDAAICAAPSINRGNGRFRGGFRIVYCGRLISLKRVELLLDALAQIDPAREWQLDVLGDGPLRQELTERTGHLGLSTRVHFHGNVANPYAFFAKADLGVLCSRIEGFPNVLLEMMASGTKQIITTPCTPAVRQLPQAEILEEASARSLAALIDKTMRLRPDNAQPYRQHVQQVHSIEGFAQTVLGQAPTPGLRTD